MKNLTDRLKKAISLAGIGLALVFFAHCITPPKAVDTQALKAKTAAEREVEYKFNAITPGNMFAAYKVGQAPYPAEQLSPLFDASYVAPATKSKYSSGSTWNIFGSVFAAAGGGMIGYNAGTALGGGQANTGLWIGGGASLLVGIIFGVVADGKYTDASNLYNDDLRKALDLQQKTAAVRPQEQYAHYMLSYGSSF